MLNNIFKKIIDFINELFSKKLKIVTEDVIHINEGGELIIYPKFINASGKYNISFKLLSIQTHNTTSLGVDENGFIYSLNKMDYHPVDKYHNYMSIRIIITDSKGNRAEKDIEIVIDESPKKNFKNSQISSEDSWKIKTSLSGTYVK